MLDINEKSKKNEILSNELFERERKARNNGDLEEARFLMRVRHCVELGVAMEHDDSTRDICPRCQKPMEIKHEVYCQYCGQLVK